jgi:RNA polymerase sigma factor (sigma-70 family)
MLLLDEIIVEQYMFLVEIVAHKFRKKNIFENIQDSEAYSVASIELVKAAATYDPKVNPDFSRYAYRIMCNGVVAHFRYQNRKKRIADHVYMTDREWGELKEKKPLESSEFSGNKELILKLFENRPEDSHQDRLDKRLLLEIYINGKKIPVIAEQYGVSRVTVYNRIKRITNKIRQRHADLMDLYGGDDL